MTELVPEARRSANRSGRRLHQGMPRLAVVVPARNEERRLPHCLAAMERAESALRAAYPAVLPTRIVMVLDRCTDGSQALLADRPSIEVVISDHGRVGAARAAGVQVALGSPDGHPTPSWVACTDADSAVPADWLITQLQHCAAGTELLLGLVRPDPAELAPDLLESWKLAHLLTEGHPHIHGANLGISAEMYARCGGFADVAAHEDALLVAGVRAVGGRVVSTSSSPVLTSGRLSGRAPAGMASYLSGLSERDEAIAS